MCTTTAKGNEIEVGLDANSTPGQQFSIAHPDPSHRPPYIATISHDTSSQVTVDFLLQKISVTIDKFKSRARARLHFRLNDTDRLEEEEEKYFRDLLDSPALMANRLNRSGGGKKRETNNNVEPKPIGHERKRVLMFTTSNFDNHKERCGIRSCMPDCCHHLVSINLKKETTTTTIKEE